MISSCSCPLPSSDHFGAGGYHFRPIVRADLLKRWPPPPDGETELHRRMVDRYLASIGGHPSTSHIGYERCPAFAAGVRREIAERKTQRTREANRSRSHWPTDGL